MSDDNLPVVLEYVLKTPEECNLTNEEYGAITAMYLGGAFDVEVQSYLSTKRKNFNKKIWQQWLASDPEFAALVEQGKIDRETFWIRKGVSGMNDRSFNSSLWLFFMKNQFGWKDNMTIGGDKDNPVKLDTEITIKLVAPDGDVASLTTKETEPRLVN